MILKDKYEVEEFDNQTIFNIPNTIDTNNKVIKNNQYIGIASYILVVIIIIPLILMKYKQYEILSMYMLNVDMIATCLQYNNGPPTLFGGNMFKSLYNSRNLHTKLNFISTNFINYVALLGVTFMISYLTYTRKSIIHGWTPAFFMLLITYLLPAHLIIRVQQIVGNFINNTMHIYTHTNIHYILTVGIGLLLTFFIIHIESFYIKHFSFEVSKAIEIIFNKYKLHFN